VLFLSKIFTTCSYIVLWIREQYFKVKYIVKKSYTIFEAQLPIHYNFAFVLYSILKQILGFLLSVYFLASSTFLLFCLLNYFKFLVKFEKVLILAFLNWIFLNLHFINLLRWKFILVGDLGEKLSIFLGNLLKEWENAKDDSSPEIIQVDAQSKSDKHLREKKATNSRDKCNKNSTFVFQICHGILCSYDCSFVNFYCFVVFGKYIKNNLKFKHCNSKKHLGVKVCQGPQNVTYTFTYKNTPSLLALIIYLYIFAIFLYKNQRLKCLNVGKPSVGL